MTRRRALVGGGIVLVALLLAGGLVWFDRSPASEPIPPVVTVPSEPTPTAGAAERASVPVASLEGSPDGVVECELVRAEVPISSLVHELDLDTEEPIGIHQIQRIEDHWFRFRPRAAIGVGVLRGRRFQDQPFGWADGVCTTTVELTPRVPAVVHVVAENVVYDEPLMVTGCGVGSDMRDGVDRLELYEPGTCELHLWQMVMHTSLKGPAVEVEVVPGQERTITLQGPMPPDVPAGMVGWRLRDGGDYTRVDSVVPGSPADHAGIRPGDQIVGASGSLHEMPVVVELAGQQGTREVEIRPLSPAPTDH